MEHNLYTNRNTHGDFISNAFEGLHVNPVNIFIATAFFTDADIVKKIVDAGCKVRIVVRLGFPTHPAALDALMGMENVESRFFTKKEFHPKLYIFGDRSALVGSANLTNAGMNTNQEIMFRISSTQEEFNELAVLFGEYWDEASVLTREDIEKYKMVFAKYAVANKKIGDLEREVEKELGVKGFSNINRGKRKVAKKTIFLEEYKKTYQESVAAFKHVRESYMSIGRRKISEDKIPLRLEIDSFISFVREVHAKKDEWRQKPLGNLQGNMSHFKALVEEWLQTPWLHFEDVIVNKRYPGLLKVFNSEAGITSSSDDELFEALETVHSFRDRLRFYEGGLDSLKREFLKANDSKHLRESLSYLVYGNDPVIERMANVIFDSDYKLACFGPSNVQELIGWINKEDLPVINGRTTKVLRYFGFDVRQM